MFSVLHNLPFHTLPQCCCVRSAWRQNLGQKSCVLIWHKKHRKSVAPNLICRFPRPTYKHIPRQMANVCVLRVKVRFNEQPVSLPAGWHHAGRSAAAFHSKSHFGTHMPLYSNGAVACWTFCPFHTPKLCHTSFFWKKVHTFSEFGTALIETRGIFIVYVKIPQWWQAFLKPLFPVRLNACRPHSIYSFCLFLATENVNSRNGTLHTHIQLL